MDQKTQARIEGLLKTKSGKGFRKTCGYPTFSINVETDFKTIPRFFKRAAEISQKDFAELSEKDFGESMIYLSGDTTFLAPLIAFPRRWVEGSRGLGYLTHDGTTEFAKELYGLLPRRDITIDFAEIHAIQKEKRYELSITHQPSGDIYTIHGWLYPHQPEMTCLQSVKEFL